jgi:hypothetical protein
MHLFTDVSETGLVTEYVTEGQKLIVRGKQNTDAEMTHVGRLRNDADYGRQGIKNDMQHVAHIPDGVCMEWKTKHGFDVFKAHPREIARFIEARPEYWNLKTTHGRIAR